MTAPVDIFISYKREERVLAQDVGRVLQEAGYTTVTDLNIKKSKDFGDAIDEMIRQARLVVVLWTPMSAESNWVKMEAREANTLQKYFGVVMKPLERRDLPLELRRKQYLDLGGKMPRDLSLVVRDVASLIGEGSNTEEEANVASEELNDDFHLFQVVDRLGYAEGYQAYLDDYPNGIFAARAKAKVASAQNVPSTGSETLLREPASTFHGPHADLLSAQKKIKSLERELAAKSENASPSWSQKLRWAAPALGILAFLLAVLVFSSTFIPKTVSEVRDNLSVTAIAPEVANGNRLTYQDLPVSLQCLTYPYTFVQTLKAGYEYVLPSSTAMFNENQVPGVVLATEAGEVCLPTTLEGLRLRGPDVEDISVIGYLPGLREFFLDKTNVEDILPVTTLGNLKRLEIVGSPVSSIAGLENVKTLRDVRLGDTAVRSVESLKELPNLHYFQRDFGVTAGNPLIDTDATRLAVHQLVTELSSDGKR